MSRLLAAVSALAISTALAGCATQAAYPVTPSAAAPPPVSEAAVAAPPPAPGEQIDSGYLPLPRAAAPSATELPPVSSYNPPAPSYAPPPPPPEPPRTVMSKPQAAAKVVVDAPPPVKVGKGDTLIAISRKTGFSVEILAKLNDLKKPYPLKPGQSIKLPSKRYYPVQSGDTLFAVAKRFGLAAADLAEFNDFTTGVPIRRGQKLYLPPEAKDKGAPKPVPIPAPRPAARPAPPPPPVWTPPRQEPAPVPRPQPAPPPAPSYTPPPPPQPAPPPRQPAPTAPPQTGPRPIWPTRPPEPAPSPPPRAQQPYRPEPSAPSYTPSRPPIIESAAPLSDSQIAAAGRGRFVWPVRGDVVSRFGVTGGGQRNDGVNIAAGIAEGVRSAAAGEVVYAGNQVPGFGNLVLIKHDGGWVTAYAHLSNIDVKMRQSISQGQVIGQVGQTGSVDQPQLHFEIRYAPSPKDKARPIDPMLVLPQ